MNRHPRGYQITSWPMTNRLESRAESIARRYRIGKLPQYPAIGTVKAMSLIDTKTSEPIAMYWLTP